MNKKVGFSEIMPLIDDAFASGKSVKIRISGSSMRPLVSNERDFVYLRKPDAKPKKRDVVLYVRDDGTYVMHRIVKIIGDELFICGDNQTEIERGITSQKIIAKAEAFERNGKYIDCKSLKYKLYSVFWCAVLPKRSKVKKLNRILRGKK